LNTWRLAPTGIKVLCISSLLMNMGFFALIPYLTLYLTGSFAWSMAMTGILFGVRQFSQQGLTFIGGLIADRFGCKQTLIWGVWIRSVGFASFAFCGEVWHFFVAAIVSGIGGALFEPSFQAAFAKLSPDEHRKALFSFKNVMTNIGIIVSTLIGSIVSSFDFFYLSITSGAIYILIALLCNKWLPDIEVEISLQSWTQDIQIILKNKPFVIYTFILIGYYYLYMQLFLTVPKFAQTLTGSAAGVGYVYSTISITVILFQMRIAKTLEKYSNRFTMIGIGTLFMGIGLFGLGFSHTLPVLLGNSVIFAFGTMISGPLLIDAVPYFAPKKQLASYYGFNGYSLAIGGALSTIIGGWFYDLGKANGWSGLPWFVCLIVAVIVAWSLHGLQASSSRKTFANIIKP
jgi:DHA1 family multidrug resistance protein-like MFS transporter